MQSFFIVKLSKNKKKKERKAYCLLFNQLLILYIATSFPELFPSLGTRLYTLLYPIVMSSTYLGLVLVFHAFPAILCVRIYVQTCMSESWQN